MNLLSSALSATWPGESIRVRAGSPDEWGVSPVEELLERFALETRYVPPHARRVRALSDLPPVLERRALHCPRDSAWCAWTDGTRFWFITGRLSAWLLQSQDRPALHVWFFDAAGELASSGVWSPDAPGAWRLLQA